MVVANRVTEKEPMRFTINLCHLRRKRLRTTVGRVRIHGSVFVLRTDGWRPKYFTTAGVQKFGRRGLISQDFHNPQRTDRRRIARAFGNVKAEADVRLPCQMIKLVRLHFRDDASDRGGVVQVGVVQEQSLVVYVFINVQMLQA